MDRHTITQQTKRKGFNLIEAAIVLGVVGIVIGGIWSAANSFHESWKVNKTVSDLLLIVKNTQSLISAANSLSMGQNANITQTLIAASSIPQDWIFGTTVKSPFGDVIIANFIINHPVPAFTIQLYDVPISSCIKLITKISESGFRSQDNALQNSAGANALTTILVLNGSNELLRKFPISISKAETACTAISNQVNFTFAYTRTN